MSDFNINGGYFAPLGYAKVEAGGSHEENPNGGVQLGADAQGVPNLLEEGEIVFNDFVYSDNIHAEGGMLEKHNLPKNYSGNLYSDIADDMINNAAPGDNIAMNGLKKFLLRLAEAQEEQKSIKEQTELEEELSQLSPEELHQLDAMIAQQEQPVEMEVPQEQINPEVIAPEQVAAPVEGVPEEQMMPNTYGPGGQADFAVRDNTRTRFVPEVGFLPVELNEAGLQTRRERQEEVAGAIDHLLNGPEGVNKLEITAVGDNIPAGAGQFIKDLNVAKALRTEAAAKGLAKDVKISKLSQASQKERLAKEQLRRLGVKWTDSDKIVKETKKLSNKAKSFISAGVGLGLTGAGIAWEKDNIAKAFTEHPKPATASSYDVDDIIAKYTGTPVDTTVVVHEKPVHDGSLLLKDAYTPVEHTYKNGGDTNKPNWQNAYSYKTNFHLYNPYAPTDYLYYPRWGTKVTTVEPSDSSSYTDVGYLPAAIVTASQSNATTPVVRNGRYVHKNYSSASSESASQSTAEDAPGVANRIDPLKRLEPIAGPKNARVGEHVIKLDELPVGDSWKTGMLAKDYTGSLAGSDTLLDYVKERDAEAARDSDSDGNEWKNLPTWPRYAGIGLNAALLLHNLNEEPDRYSIPDINPALPYGEMRVVPQRYQAVDPNMIANSVIAQGNATQRAINNSGAGPSTMAGLVAADYNLTNALGNAWNTGWSDANNRRNAVIAANNAAEAQRATFDFNVAEKQSDILNTVSQLRARYYMLKQQLDNAADAEQAQAISTQLNAIAKQLAGIGDENLALNMAANNTALYNRMNPDGSMPYKGFIKDINW